MISLEQIQKLVDLSSATVKCEGAVHNTKEIGASVLNYRGEKNDKKENAISFLKENISILAEASSSVTNIFSKEEE